MKFNTTTYTARSFTATGSMSVIRNTYLLLSMTLLFSAAFAYLSVIQGAGFGATMVAFVGSFVFLFVTNALRNSVWGIASVFAFTACMGYSLGPLLNHFIHGYRNGGQLIVTALGSTGLVFFLTSAYVITTKRDLSHWGKFLMIGLVVCLVAILANLFFKMTAIQLAVSTLLTVISTMLMMYDTSRIINGGETNYIMATMSLYIDIQMLFQNLLMLLGFFNEK